MTRYFKPPLNTEHSSTSRRLGFFGLFTRLVKDLAFLPCASSKRGQPFPRRVIHEPDVEGGEDGCRLNLVNSLYSHMASTRTSFACSQIPPISVFLRGVQPSSFWISPFSWPPRSPKDSLMPSKSLWNDELYDWCAHGATVRHRRLHNHYCLLLLCNLDLLASLATATDIKLQDLVALPPFPTSTVQIYCLLSFALLLPGTRIRDGLHSNGTDPDAWMSFCVSFLFHFHGLFVAFPRCSLLSVHAHRDPRGFD
jgi:hypothetical protein